MRRVLSLLAVLALAVPLVPASAAGTYTVVTDVRVAMDDGVRLAADIYVPTAPDADGDGLYPCVVEVTPYRKEARHTEGSSYLPGAGIALIEVDARGTGGSEGEYDIVFSVREQADAAAMIDWAATQATKDGAALGASNKLCESTVGMYGGSYSGIIQYLVATLPPAATGDLPAAPAHLAAIAPQRAFGDLYRDIVYHGGQLIGSFGAAWSSAATTLYTQPSSDVHTGAGRDAWLDHLTKNDAMWPIYMSAQYADARFDSDDSPEPWTQRLYEDSSALPRIENLRVPALHLAGWFDTFTRGQLEVFSKAHALETLHGDRGPNILIAGPWNHSGTHFITPANFTSRLGDWYRYWLEGKDAGHAAPAWLAGPRATYFQMSSGALNATGPADGEWRTAATWPPPAASAQRLYLSEPGALSATAPSGTGTMTWAHTPAAGVAEFPSRWDNAVPVIPSTQWDQRLDAGKGAWFQTEPLAAPLRIAGPIGLTFTAKTTGAPGDPSLAGSWPGILQATPPYHDTDFIVKLSEVAPDGSMRLVTQGYLRASHRAIDPARSGTLGGDIVSPWHPHTLAALDAPDDSFREYHLGIWPTAKTFEPGHRLRIDVYSSDTPNHLTLLRPAVNTILTGPGSYLSLPATP